MKILSLITLICLIINFSAFSQWQEQVSPTTHPLYSVSVVDNSVAWACGRYGAIIRTTNGGSTWIDAAPGYFQNYVHFFSIYAIDAQTAIVAYKNLSPTGDITQLFKTTNGGSSWSVVFSQTGGAIMDIRMFDSDNGFMYTSPLNTYWRFFTSTDGGSNWSLFTTLPEQFPVEWGHYNAAGKEGRYSFGFRFLFGFQLREHLSFNGQR